MKHISLSVIVHSVALHVDRKTFTWMTTVYWQTLYSLSLHIISQHLLWSPSSVA